LSLVAALKSNGVLDDTVIVTMMDHGVVTKMALFENGSRVHMSLRYPPLGTFSKGVTYTGRVSHLDLAATLLDLAGLLSTASYDLDGDSFLADLQRVVSLRSSNSDATEYAASSVWVDDRCVFMEYEVRVVIVYPDGADG
jgi:arylsulfatase A-like enzyme